MSQRRLHVGGRELIVYPVPLRFVRNGCKLCPAQVVYVETAAGKSMPLDPMREHRVEGDDGRWMEPHFGYCPGYKRRAQVKRSRPQCLGPDCTTAAAGRGRLKDRFCTNCGPKVPDRIADRILRAAERGVPGYDDLAVAITDAQRAIALAASEQQSLF